MLYNQVPIFKKLTLGYAKRGGREMNQRTLVSYKIEAQDSFAHAE